jgi:hypothetical protein
MSFFMSAFTINIVIYYSTSPPRTLSLHRWLLLIRNRAGLLDHRRTLLSNLSSVASLQWKGLRWGEELKPSAHDPPTPGIQREEQIIYPRTQPTSPRDPERRADHLSLNTCRGAEHRPYDWIHAIHHCRYFHWTESIKVLAWIKVLTSVRVLVF